MGLVNKLKSDIFNMFGKGVNRHIIVFESDDWGAIRMPSAKVLHEIQKIECFRSHGDCYNTNDTLASNDDLELLMDVLASVEDKNGNPAKITFNCCVANPDFEKIKANNYQEYYYEPFTETLKRYPHHDRSFELWREGMRHNVIWPQFHGREHLNVPMWMQMLRDNVAQAYHAFDRGFFAFDVSLPNDPRTHALQAFNVLHKDEYTFAIQSVVDGLDLFEKLFGFRSFSMIAPCYIWDGDIECAAVNGGVRIMQGGHVQVVSAYAKSQGGKSIRHFIGDKNRYGQLYLVRNCTFEPTQSSLFNADFCMAGITSAFRFRKPAVVSCHRLNFIGEINPANRDCNLREFGRLLKMIVARYPDAEFMSSDELGRIIFEETDNIK